MCCCSLNAIKNGVIETETWLRNAIALHQNDKQLGDTTELFRPLLQGQARGNMRWFFIHGVKRANDVKTKKEFPLSEFGRID